MKRQLKNHLWLLLVLTCVFFGGCQNTGMPANKTVTLGSTPKLAVLPFENYTGDPNAGLVIMSSLQTALAAQKANILIPGEVREKLMPYEGSYLPPQKLGAILQADAVVCGDVNEYRYVYGTGEQPSLSYNVRVIDVKTGALLWSKAASDNGNFSWLQEGSLGMVARESTEKLAKEMVAKLRSKGSVK